VKQNKTNISKESRISESALLVAFSKERPARLLTDYLQNKGIKAQYVILSTEHSHGVKLIELNQMPMARRIADEFIASPGALKYQEAAWLNGKIIAQPSIDWLSFDKIFDSLKPFPFTSFVLIFCLLTYSLAVMGVSAPDNWLKILPLSELGVNHQWWRLLGPAFIHFSTLHIAFNLLWWWILARQIEQTFGSSSLLLLFLFTALTSNVAQLVIDGPNFGGLSGVVYGLVGCVWWLGWLKPNWGIGLPKPLIGFLLIWLVIGYADILWIHMANTVHTVGLLAGCLFALILTQFELIKPKADKDI
jgi:GlpG protein